jgi:hypothetical protein
MRRLLSPPYTTLQGCRGIVLSKEPRTTYNCLGKGDSSRANPHRLPTGKATVQGKCPLSASIIIKFHYNILVESP